jgi:hypothetical protein
MPVIGVSVTGVTGKERAVLSTEVSIGAIV